MACIYTFSERSGEIFHLKHVQFPCSFCGSIQYPHAHARDAVYFYLSSRQIGNSVQLIFKTCKLQAFLKNHINKMKEIYKSFSKTLSCPMMLITQGAHDRYALITP